MVKGFRLVSSKIFSEKPRPNRPICTPNSDVLYKSPTRFTANHKNFGRKALLVIHEDDDDDIIKFGYLDDMRPKKDSL